MPYTYDLNRLRRAQLERGWTDTKLASEAGVGVTTPHRLFNRKFSLRPQPATIAKIAKALDVPLDEVVVDQAKEVVG